MMHLITKPPTIACDSAATAAANAGSRRRRVAVLAICCLVSSGAVASNGSQQRTLGSAAQSDRLSLQTLMGKQAVSSAGDELGTAVDLVMVNHHGGRPSALIIVTTAGKRRVALDFNLVSYHAGRQTIEIRQVTPEQLAGRPELVINTSTSFVLRRP